MQKTTTIYNSTQPDFLVDGLIKSFCRAVITYLRKKNISIPSYVCLMVHQWTAHKGRFHDIRYFLKFWLSHNVWFTNPCYSWYAGTVYLWLYRIPCFVYQDKRCPLRSPTETLPTASDGWISTSLGEDRSKKSIQGCRVPGVVSLGVILITAVPQSPVEEGIKRQLISQFPKLHKSSFSEATNNRWSRSNKTWSYQYLK